MKSTYSNRHMITFSDQLPIIVLWVHCPYQLQKDARSKHSYLNKTERNGLSTKTKNASCTHRAKTSTATPILTNGLARVNPNLNQASCQHRNRCLQHIATECLVSHRGNRRLRGAPAQASSNKRLRQHVHQTIGVQWHPQRIAL